MRAPGDRPMLTSHHPSDRLKALRRTSAEAAQTLCFGAGILWEASAPLVAALLSLAWISGLTPLLQVWATTGLIDALTGARLPGASAGGIRSNLMWIAALIGALMIADVVNAVTPLLTAHLGERVREVTDRRIYARALRLGLAAFESPEYYDRLERARGAAAAVGVLSMARQLLAGLVGMAGIALIVARVSWPLALLLLGGAVPLALFQARQHEEFIRTNYRQSPLKRKRAYWRDLSTKRGPAAELRLFGLGDHFREGWRTLHAALMRETFAVRRRLARRGLAILWSTNVLTGVVMAGMLSAGARSTLTAGALVAIFYALRQFEEFLVGLVWQSERLMRSNADLRQLAEFMSLPGEEPAGGVPIPMPLRDGIRFENVSFTYPGAAEPALRDVSLHLRPGERLAIVGENGAGKSTLARLLLGLYAPTDGRILVDGINLAEADRSAWRARSAAVFQSFVQYQLTVRENVGFGEPAALRDADRITAAARRSGAHDVIAALPAGLETLLGKGFQGAQELSIGQWQKLAIARAYLRDADVLVLDEPAASLDALAEREVYREFSSASEGRTVLLISHRLGSARLADRIVVLEQGRAVEVGRHDELIARGGPYAEMYALQAEWYREGP